VRLDGGGIRRVLVTDNGIASRAMSCTGAHPPRHQQDRQSRRSRACRVARFSWRSAGLDCRHRDVTMVSRTADSESGWSISGPGNWNRPRPRSAHASRWPICSTRHRPGASSCARGHGNLPTASPRWSAWPPPTLRSHSPSFTRAARCFRWPVQAAQQRALRLLPDEFAPAQREVDAAPRASACTAGSVRPLRVGRARRTVFLRQRPLRS